METTRNWSAICDFLGGDFGLRSFYTREQWIEQAFEWMFDDVNPEDKENLASEQMEYWDWINSLDDEELMHYISNNWEIGIRETTWLKLGNDCYWQDPEGATSGVYTILDIRAGKYGELAEDTILLLTDGWGENEVFLRECYGLAQESCPKCGGPLYVSDLC
jgi:hypothetical protein